MDKYDRQNPYLARLKERRPLSGPFALKDTYHLVLDIANSGITYEVGNAIGILPQNPPSLIQKTLNALNSFGSEQVYYKRSNTTTPLKELLKEKVNLARVHKNLIQEIYNRQTNPSKKACLQNLLLPENKEQLEEYLSTHFLWDLLEEHPEASFTTHEICGYLTPLLPRLYSVASSMKAVGEEVHLIIATVKYITNSQVRKGVCSHFLCEETPLGSPIVPMYVQPGSNLFGLPPDPSKDIIMVGPGVGVAPFRGFIQERVLSNASGKNWLFFGTRKSESEFYYKEEWLAHISQGKLKAHFAFSQDQVERIYVQHRMLEHSKELWKWIENGAYFYVCGDAKYMARDVEATLHQIIRTEASWDSETVEAYVHQMKKDKRYLRDVY